MYYLSPTIGTGVDGDEYRPKVADYECTFSASYNKPGGNYSVARVQAAAGVYSQIEADADMSKLDYGCEMALIFPIYNQAGLNYFLGLKEYVRPCDTVFVTAGTFAEIDVNYLVTALPVVKAEFPNNRIFAGCGGLSNLQILVNNLPFAVDAVVSVYEPNIWGGDFDWDYEHTKAKYTAANAVVTTAGLQCFMKPTGRPALRLPEYGWNYKELNGLVSGQIIQTQTYCKAGDYGDVLDVLLSQGLTPEDNWYPHHSLLPTSPNGVDASYARGSCLQSLRQRGINRTLIWWAHNAEGVVQLESYLSLLRE